MSEIPPSWDLLIGNIYYMLAYKLNVTYHLEMSRPSECRWIDALDYFSIVSRYDVLCSAVTIVCEARNYSCIVCIIPVRIYPIP